jgi:hypothetical protein
LSQIGRVSTAAQCFDHHQVSLFWRAAQFGYIRFAILLAFRTAASLALFGLSLGFASRTSCGRSISSFRQDGIRRRSHPMFLGPFQALLRAKTATACPALICTLAAATTILAGVGHLLRIITLLRHHWQRHRNNAKQYDHRQEAAK